MMNKMKRKKILFKNLNVRLRNEILEQIIAEADRRNMTLSELVREIISKYLDEKK